MAAKDQSLIRLIFLVHLPVLIWRIANVLFEEARKMLGVLIVRRFQKNSDFGYRTEPSFQPQRSSHCKVGESIWLAEWLVTN